MIIVLHNSCKPGEFLNMTYKDEIQGSSLPIRVQVLDDDATTVVVLSHILRQQNWETLSARCIDEACSELNQTVPDVAVVDVFLGGEDGLDYVAHLRENHSDIGIVVISGEDTETLAKKAGACGADFFLSKPIAPAALILTIKKLTELRQQRQRSHDLARELQRSVRDSIFPDILAHSDSMRAVLKLVEKVSVRDLSVLVFGESGTGKELVARAIHESSSRGRGPFIELNCAALPPNLVESELFGHEKGAFTGAIAARAGKMELANGGTLFLDEIGELPLEIQPKFLRALQERRVTRVGGKNDIHCDFRLISATNCDLLEQVRNSQFREDLFYRVAVFPIKIPPLRDRSEDLELLLAHFLKQEGVKNPQITDGAREMLRSHAWPGNVRELKNFAQAVTLLTEDDSITEESVRTYFGSRMGTPATNGDTPQTPMLGAFNNNPRPVRKLEDVEREEILHALRVHQGNVPEAARALGMGRATLYKYLKKKSIDQSAFSQDAR